MPICGSVFLATACIVSVFFWHLFGHSLDYSVYANDTYWYSEEFSLEFRIGITVLVGFVAAALPTWLVYAFRHDYCRVGKADGASSA